MVSRDYCLFVEIGSGNLEERGISFSVLSILSFGKLLLFLNALEVKPGRLKNH